MWIPAIVAAAVFAASFATIVWRGWNADRLSAAAAEETVRDGVEVVVEETTVLDESAGCLKSRGFALRTAGERIEIPEGALVMLSTRSLILPQDLRLRALLRFEEAPDAGPMRTPGRRDPEGVVVLAHVDPLLRAPRQHAASWSIAVVVLGVAATLVVFADRIGLLAAGIGGVAAVLFAWDIARNDRALVAQLVARRRPPELEPVVLRARQAFAVIGLAICLGASIAIACVLPRISGWTVAHASRAPLDHIDPDLEGHVIAVSGPLSSRDRATDPELLIGGDNLAVWRTVERERLIQRGGRPSAKVWTWQAETIGGLASRRWQVGRVQLGAYELDLTGVTLPPPSALPIETRELRAGEQLEGVRWNAATHTYLAEHARIRFDGLAAGTEVTVIAIQRGSELVAIDDARDGTTGIQISSDPPAEQTFADPWPDDDRFFACEWLVLLGVLFAFSRARDGLIALGAAGGVLLLGTVLAGVEGGIAATALLVPWGFVLLTFPKSLLAACAAGLLIAAPLAVARATTPELGIGAAIASVVVLGLLRVSLGWHRTTAIDWD